VLTSLLNLPYTWFSSAGLLNLWRRGVLFVRSARIFFLASPLRSAICTLDSRRNICVELVGLASCDLAVLPLERAWRRQPWGHHWDSWPPAFLLQDAAANFLSMPGISNEVSVAVAATVAAKEAFANGMPGKKFKFQRVLSGFLLDRLYPDDVSNTILLRVRRFNPELAPLITPEVLENVRAFSASLPASVAQQLFRLHLGKWLDHKFPDARSPASELHLWLRR